MDKVLLKKESIIGRRMGAFLTDHILITIVAMVPFMINFNKLVEDTNYIFEIFSIVMFIGIIFYLLKDIIFGRSIGKILFGIYVKDYEDIEKSPPLLNLIIRNILVFIWPIEFIIMLIDKDGRRLGDKIAKTQVIGYPGKIVSRIVLVGALSFALFVTTLVIGVTQIIRNDSSYKTALQYIKTQDEIKSEVGEIEGFGNFPMGSVSISNGYGVADLQIKVKGKKKSITVSILMEKSPESDWVVKDIKH